MLALRSQGSASVQRASRVVCPFVCDVPAGSRDVHGVVVRRYVDFITSTLPQVFTALDVTTTTLIVRGLTVPLRCTPPSLPALAPRAALTAVPGWVCRLPPSSGGCPCFARTASWRSQAS